MRCYFSQQLKDLLLLRTHPIFAKKGQGGPSDGQLSAEASKLMKESTPTILVDKKQILPALRSLVTLLLATEVEVHLDRFLLTSKVSFQIFSLSDFLLATEVIVNLRSVFSQMTGKFRHPICFIFSTQLDQHYCIVYMDSEW